MRFSEKSRAERADTQIGAAVLVIIYFPHNFVKELRPFAVAIFVLYLRVFF